MLKDCCPSILGKISLPKIQVMSILLDVFFLPNSGIPIIEITSRFNDLLSS